jgi:CheY-like chemotaxis protein
MKGTSYPTGRVLIVDDNSLALAARRSVLEELGHDVQTSATAMDALDKCASYAFDVVITDYKMPKMNGVELIDRLRKVHPAVSVILVSGFTDSLGLDEASTGADIVLQKSNNEVSQMIRAVNRLLRKARKPLNPVEPLRESKDRPKRLVKARRGRTH